MGELQTRMAGRSKAVVKTLLFEVQRRRGVLIADRPGHFYSPYPRLDELERRAESIFSIPESIPGIDLRSHAQLDYVRQVSQRYEDQPFGAVSTPENRYHFENPFFSYGDGLLLHLILLKLRPQRVIEVGSGFSSAMILDTVGTTAECTFIEPYPDRLDALLNPEDRRRHRILERPVQDVDLSLFDALESGDVLFIDSTHVSRVGSDVHRLFFEVLPRLRPGVMVHIHDVFYPFEYPKAWVMSGRVWTEAYLLRALLMHSNAFRIEVWNSYLAQFHRDEMTKLMPLWALNTGGSIWISRL